MHVHAMRLGPLSTNCYLVWDDALEAVLIDAGGGATQLLEFIAAEQLHLRAIINTHGHYDHIAVNEDILQQTGAEVLIHSDDALHLTDVELNLAGHFAPRFRGKPATRLLCDGEIIRIGTLEFEVVHTPGHTPGGICLICDGALFSGDTLFAGNIGRSDLVGGNEEQLLQSLKYRIWPIQEDLHIYPGHGPQTTLAKEKANNRWMHIANTLPNEEKNA